MVRAFVQHGFDLSSRDGYYGYTILHYFARYGFGIEILKGLVQEYQLDLNVTCVRSVSLPVLFSSYILVSDSSGYTPLHVAILCDNIVFANALVNMGADVSLPGKFGLTPLHCSVRVHFSRRLYHIALIYCKESD